jgi:hypothetical protein
MKLRVRDERGALLPLGSSEMLPKYWPGNMKERSRSRSDNYIKIDQARSTLTALFFLTSVSRRLL